MRVGERGWLNEGGEERIGQVMLWVWLDNCVRCGAVVNRRTLIQLVLPCQHLCAGGWCQEMRTASQRPLGPQV